MPYAFANSRISPVRAFMVLVATHAALLLAALAFVRIELVSDTFGLLSVVVPGLLAGYLTASKPALVGITGAAAKYVIGLLAMLYMFGELPVGLLLFDIVGAVAQAAITLGACVGAYTLRHRLAEQGVPNVN